MKKWWFALSLLCLICLSAFSQDHYDPELASKYDADDYGMKKYVMAFLKRGPSAESFTDQERMDIQKRHLDYIQKMAEDKKIILAGPFLDDGNLRGIFLFNITSLDSAQKWTSNDPAVQAGVLTMELKQWYGSAGIMAIPELHKKLQRKDY
ncbi:YciI family protein [Echinicola jeungdonensis]|uniref:YciI family protein n=1 Tax=Echinicola jeungdonensis TaxID=709343 RepID=A0ABV5J627_9BACT|nr:YciI family protein [Echinicola jeungdonensis]MDN3668042.1 YciI family protein [Echinicola jeungdonensis]